MVRLRSIADQAKLHFAVVVKYLLLFLDWSLSKIGLQRVAACKGRPAVLMYFTLSGYLQDIKRERAARATRTLVS